MALPLFKSKDRPLGTMIIEDRKPDSPQEDSAGDEGLQACAQDLMSAIESKNAKGIASALRAAFDILDSMPHEEGPHTNEE